MGGKKRDDTIAGDDGQESGRRIVVAPGDSTVYIDNATGPVHVGSGDQINVIYRRG